MSEHDRRIGPLEKVTLLMEARGDRGDSAATREEVRFEFIYGIGPQGLTPFEFELSSRKSGDELSIGLTKGDMEAFFQHLIPPFNLRETEEAFSIRVRVIDVAPADQREVIQAMAEAASCADHCCGH